MACTNSLLLLIVNIQIAIISFLLYDKFYIKKFSSNTNNRTATENLRKDSIPIVGTSLPEHFSTSVYCTGETKDKRECRFQNLCFDPVTDEYLFFHGNSTRIFGVPYNISKSILLDLSSVNDHNGKYFRYTDVLRKTYGNRNIDYVNGGTILFHRFNPENIMHVIHDDLLPFFHTSRKYFLANNRVKSFMMDGRDKGPYFDLYELFMKSFFTREDIKKLTCFQDVIVGLNKATTWYQYGFQTPQGPINVDNYPVNELLYFREAYQRLLNETHHDGQILNNESDEGCIVYISRKINRKIINEMQLVLKLSTYFSMQVHIVDLQYDSIYDIVSLISQARILVAVHGAHLITSLFLSPIATLVEIFPFAVSAENFTPYKTLTGLLNVNYVAWENKIETNSVTHPDWAPNLGGILHLPKDLQDQIIETKTVPPHLCCHDPFWLYRIYQDTRVDIEDFLNHISSKISTTSSSNVLSSNDFQFFYPSMVKNVICNYVQTSEMMITWDIPWNMQWVPNHTIAYEVIQSSHAEDGSSPVDAIHTVKGKETLLLHVDKNGRYVIYIRCIFQGRMGEFSKRLQC